MHQMEITAVEVHPCTNGEPPELLAYCSLIVNGALKVNGLRIIEKPSGRFVAMPSRRHKDGSFRDVSHPISREARGYLEETVLNAYQSAITSGESYIIPKALHLT